MAERPIIFITVHGGQIDVIQTVGLPEARIIEVSCDGGAGEDFVPLPAPDVEEERPAGVNLVSGAHVSELLYKDYTAAADWHQEVLKFLARKTEVNVVRSTHENTEELLHASAVCPFCHADNVVVVGGNGMDKVEICSDFVDYNPGEGRAKGTWKFRRYHPPPPGPEPVSDQPPFPTGPLEPPLRLYPPPYEPDPKEG